MPVREIEKKYTVSELVMMAWDSRQKAYALNQMYKKPKDTSASQAAAYVSSHGITETANAYEMPKDINRGVSIPKTFFNKEGEIDLRQVTGPQAVNYLNALGLNIATRMF